MSTHRLIYMAIIASLALAGLACNKEKVRRQAPREVIPAEEQGGEVFPPGEGQPPGQGQPPGEEDDFQMRPWAPEPLEPDDLGNEGYAGPEEDRGEAHQGRPRFRLPPPRRGGTGGGSEGPGGDHSEDDRHFSEAWENRTGGFFSEDLFYVGAGPDQLVSSLRAKMESVDRKYQERNQALADKILIAKLNLSKGHAEVTLAVGRGSRARGERSEYETVVIAGEYRVPGPSVIRASANQNPWGEPIEGVLRCMDADPSRDRCETAFLRLSVGHPGQRAIANLIFRETRSNIYVQYPDSVNESHSRHYRQLRNYLFNAQAGKRVKESFRKIEYSSFAVVMGRSGFHVLMETRDEQMVEFKGALLASRSGTTNITTSLPRSFGDYYGYNLAEGIEKAHLVRTDGRGEIGLRVTTKADRRGPEAELIFNFMRKVGATLPLE